MLAGAALGAGFCLGVDLSRAAVRLARENARENGLAAAVRLVQGSTECLRGPFDLVLANLRWPVQMAKVTELDRLTAPSGALILSGFRDVQEARTPGRLPGPGLVLSQPPQPRRMGHRGAAGEKLHLGGLAAAAPIMARYHYAPSFQMAFCSMHCKPHFPFLNLNPEQRFSKKELVCPPI